MTTSEHVAKAHEYLDLALNASGRGDKRNVAAWIREVRWQLDQINNPPPSSTDTALAR